MQKVFDRACKRVRIDRRVPVHTMRHSFATHLPEGGTDLRYVRELLGLKTPKTTQINRRVTRRDIAQVQIPLDDLVENEEEGSG